jgi:hypothetical protein
MRSLGIRTHVLLALAAAAGLVATLGRPWYAAAPAVAPGSPGNDDIQQRATTIAEAVQRWVTESGGTTGWDALDHTGVALAAMGGVAGLGALMCLAPGLQALGRDVLRYGAYAALGIVVWRLFDSPGPNAAMELRNGALAAAGCAIVLLACASSVTAAKLQRNPARPAPPAYDAL